MLAVDIFMSYDIPFDGLLRNTTGLLPSAYIHNHSSASLNHKQTDSEVKCFQLKAVLGAALTWTRVRSSMRPVKQKPRTEFMSNIHLEAKKSTFYEEIGPS